MCSLLSAELSLLISAPPSQRLTRVHVTFRPFSVTVLLHRVLGTSFGGDTKQMNQSRGRQTVSIW
ncbi:rCG25014 [Rattus norvegicus]|uniref:RCG25014 n=1 Tax=Rattus norvegicus TaxID=10116 RepID=A6KFF0_RAT|nr:rCG25014 [Rattus norvegicus]